MRKINKIIIHCTATPEGREVTTDDLRQWHVKERGWSDIGYHFFIDLEGCLHECRPIERTGAHCKGHNWDSIGVAYAGGMSEGEPYDTRTEEQKDALYELLLKLKESYRDATIYGHCNFSSKECPSFDAKTEYENISNYY
jgi:N-acetylmuramoyl-L-alanine amidase